MFGSKDQSKVSDQNKVNSSKTIKSKVSSLKSSTSDKTNTSKEITRLEALCEVRTKDLNYTKLQLKSSLTAFDAMAVLVNYLANEIDAFACPTLTVKLNEVQEELTQAEDQIEKLKEQQVKLEQDILDCNKQHEKALTDLVNAQSINLLSQKEVLTQQNTENIRKVKEEHAQELEKIKTLQAEKKSDLTLEHKNNVDNLRLTHLEEIRTLQRKHENQMEDLHRQHRDKLEAITHTFESIKMTLSEKVESLRCECEEFRNRARMCEEALEQEANVRVQTALSPYRDLPREIESLKTVLEMRNQEIHDLRTQKIDLEKQLEELPPALEKITLLQQKIENLEAILQIKSDHEKQLNEKCHGLMRKFNKETRANKRLSMEFDELKWRMSQSELSGSQENILKMYSCSPSGSESGSPDPTRRFSRSPKHWDHRDGGGDQLSSSVTGDGSMESKVKRRSGTFIVHDRPSPLSSPKNKSVPGMPAINMSQSWAGTGESTTVPSPEESKPLSLSPPSQSLGLPVQPVAFLEVSTSERMASTESVKPQENVDEKQVISPS